MNWLKANIFVGHKGEVRGQFRAAAVPVAQAPRPKTITGFLVRGAFQAYRPAEDATLQTPLPVPTR